MPSTTTLCLSCRTRSTRPVVRAPAVPASSPAITSTMSSLRICMGQEILLNHFRGETDNAGKAPLAKFSRHRAENARPARVLFVIDENECIAIEAHVTSIASSRAFLAANDDPFDHFTGLHVAAGNRLF